MVVIIKLLSIRFLRARKPLILLGLPQSALLFPLNCRDGFVGHIPENAVHTGHFCDHTVTDSAQGLPGKNYRFCSDCIYGVDSADDDSPTHVALAVLDAGRLHVGNNGKVLPGRLIKLADLFSYDGVSFTQRFKPVAGYCAYTAHAETGAGERLTVYHVVGKSESFSYYSYLVLVKQLYRLYELEVKIFRKTADVVMGFDAVALKDVGIDGALGEELDAVQFLGFFCEDSR